ncbi:hypothetical protein SK128_011904 [Halocaridina rubra]|uniref:Uncharacterized protein n=1 Tax=Halocaridina rubra TaxID=373956 RepID=A0AAN8XHM2_HALRR
MNDPAVAASPYDMDRHLVCCEVRTPEQYNVVEDCASSDENTEVVQENFRDESLQGDKTEYDDSAANHPENASDSVDQILKATVG